MTDGHVATINEDDIIHGPAHDRDILPHSYNDEDLNNLFPQAVAPEDPDGVSTDQCICGRPTCVKCFPPDPRAPCYYCVFRESW